MQNKLIYKTLIYCCALIPLFFSVAWIYNFGFTNYRANLAYIGLPLGIAMLILSISMFLLNRVAIIISMVLSTMTLLIAAYVFSITLHWFYALVVLTALTYLYYSKKYLWPTPIHT